MKNNKNKNEEISLRINLGTRPVFGHGKAKLLDAISIERRNEPITEIKPTVTVDAIIKSLLLRSKGVSKRINSKSTPRIINIKIFKQKF